MKKKTKIIISITVIVVFLIGAFFGYLHGCKQAEEDIKMIKGGISNLPATVDPTEDSYPETTEQTLTTLPTDNTTEE